MVGPRYRGSRTPPSLPVEGSCAFQTLPIGAYFPASVSVCTSSSLSLSRTPLARLLTCSTEVAEAIGAVTPGWATSQASDTSAGVASLALANLIECGKDAFALGVEVFLHAAAARGFAEIGLASDTCR